MFLLCDDSNDPGLPLDVSAVVNFAGSGLPRDDTAVMAQVINLVMDETLYLRVAGHAERSERHCSHPDSSSGPGSGSGSS